jgi:tetratricopeptide (TPR) repeat protein
LVIHSSLPHNHPTATSQPKGEEANRLIDTALRKDPYSHITHHVHSIILRADKDFAGAADALRKARDIDPENIPLIRDSISLYTQLKHYDEAQQARIKYHTLRPNMKANWVTVAVGYELCGEPQNALNVYDQLGKALKVSQARLVQTCRFQLRLFALPETGHRLRFGGESRAVYPHDQADGGSWPVSGRPRVVAQVCRRQNPSTNLRRHDA